MKIIIAGGSGFIGSALVVELKKRGHEVVVLTRQTNAPHYWNPKSKEYHPASFKDIDVVINLAGSGIADRRWTQTRKLDIIQSRVLATELLVNIVSQLDRPITWIQSSAVGYYGSEINDEPADENSSAGNDFLSRVCVEWENASILVQKSSNVRFVLFRIGVVLDESGGALKRMLPLFRLGLGSAVAPGNQWMNPIERKDLIHQFVCAIENNRISGVYNAVRNNNVTAAEFAQEMGRKIGKSVWMPQVPAWLMRLFFGEMADVLTKGRKVVSKRWQDWGDEQK